MGANGCGAPRASAPPPPPELGEPAAEGPKGKRPWGRPHMRVIEMDFISAGSPGNPYPVEANDNIGGDKATYRPS